MYAVGDAQWLMYPVGDGEERRISAMYAVGNTQWLMYPVGDGGGEEDLCHVRSGGHSCTQWGMGEERRISAMYAVGDAQ